MSSTAPASISARTPYRPFFAVKALPSSPCQRRKRIGATGCPSSKPKRRPPPAQLSSIFKKIPDEMIYPFFRMIAGIVTVFAAAGCLRFCSVYTDDEKMNPASKRRGNGRTAVARWPTRVGVAMRWVDTKNAFGWPSKIHSQKIWLGNRLGNTLHSFCFITKCKRKTPDISAISGIFVGAGNRT